LTALAISMQHASVCHFSSDFCHHFFPSSGFSAESIISSMIESAKANLSSNVDLINRKRKILFELLRIKKFSFVTFS